MSEIKCGEKIVMINQTMEIISDLEIQIRKEIEERRNKSIAWMEEHRQWVQKHCSTPA